MLIFLLIASLPSQLLSTLFELLSAEQFAASFSNIFILSYNTAFITKPLLKKLKTINMNMNETKSSRIKTL